MISIGQIYCDGCKDAFYPEGVSYQDEPNFCSEECEDGYEADQAAEASNLQAYHDGRYGGAPVHE